MASATVRCGAMRRAVQCVLFPDMDSNVFVTTSSTCAPAMDRTATDRGSSRRPSTRFTRMCSGRHAGPGGRRISTRRETTNWRKRINSCNPSALAPLFKSSPTTWRETKQAMASARPGKWFLLSRRFSRLKAANSSKAPPTSQDVRPPQPGHRARIGPSRVRQAHSTALLGSKTGFHEVGLQISRVFHRHAAYYPLGLPESRSCQTCGFPMRRAAVLTANRVIESHLKASSAASVVYQCEGEGELCR